MKATMTTKEKIKFAEKTLVDGEDLFIMDGDKFYDYLETELKLDIKYHETHVAVGKKINDHSVLSIEFYKDHNGSVLSSKRSAVLEAAAIIGRDFT